METTPSKSKIALEEKTVCLATFTLKREGKRLGRTVFTYQLLDYIRPRAKKFLCIEQPFSLSEDLTPTLEIYEKGRLVQRHAFPLPRALASRRRDAEKPSFGLKLRDVISMVYFLGKIRTHIDLFIAVEGVNAIMGIILRSIGITDSVIYCVEDYMPKRFENPMANGVFHLLDQICVRFSDFAWNHSPRVKQTRERLHGPQNGAVQLSVPMACPEPIEKIREVRRGKTDVVYIGNLHEKFGVELLVRAFARVISRIPDATLHIIGDGIARGKIERYIRENNLLDRVRTYGILHNEEADKIVASSRIGVAPYLILDGNSQFIYSDVGKVKLYLAYGLPVVVTKYAATAIFIRDYEAGLLVNCEEEEIAQAIVRLLSDEALYARLHTNATTLASELRPEKVFEKPLELALRDGYSGVEATL